MNFLRKYTMALSPLVLLSYAYAEEVSLEATSSSDSYYTQEVVVTATQTENIQKDLPVSTTAIDIAEMNQAGLSDVGDVLKYAGGLEMSGTPRRNSQQVFMRGYGEEAINITIDGIPQRIETGHTSSFYIEPELLSKVEVVRGPNSAIYGSRSLGGSIAFLTVEAEDVLQAGDNIGGKFFGGYSSVNEEYHLGTIAGLRGENYDAVAGITWRDGGDIDLSDGSVLNSDDEVLSGLAKVNFVLSDEAMLRFGFVGYNGDAEEPNNPQSISTTDIVDREVRSLSGYVGFDYDSLTNDWIDFSSQIYWQQTKIDQDFVIGSTTHNIGDNLSQKTDTYGFSFNNVSLFNLGTTEHRLLVGGDFSIDDQTSDNNGAGARAAFPDAKATYAGIYVQDEISFDSQIGRFILTPGLRYDYYKSEADDFSRDISEGELSPKFGLTYQPTEWLSLYGNYAHGFRAPSLGEVYASGTHFSIPFMGDNIFVPNYDLKPETNDSFELGVGFDFQDVYMANDNLSIRASGFYTKSKDFVDTEVNFEFFPVCCGTTRAVNIDSATLHGFDASLDYENKYMFAALNYSYVTGKNDDTDEYLTSITPHTIKTILGGKLDKYDLRFGWEAEFAARFDRVNNAGDERPGYGVHGVFVNWSPDYYKGMELSASIDNIFDKEYETIFAGVPAEGRSFNVNFSMNW
ncbi:MAG: TonB-dependent hemoglobin/transferrin/lactoferrin family receptor [Alphaproteobacteria bacterium]